MAYCNSVGSILAFARYKPLRKNNPELDTSITGETHLGVSLSVSRTWANPAESLTDLDQTQQ